SMRRNAGPGRRQPATWDYIHATTRCLPTTPTIGKTAIPPLPARRVIASAWIMACRHNKACAYKKPCSANGYWATPISWLRSRTAHRDASPPRPGAGPVRPCPPLTLELSGVLPYAAKSHPVPCIPWDILWLEMLFRRKKNGSFLLDKAAL